MVKKIIVFIICILLFSCVNNRKREIAKQMSDRLLNDIGEGLADKEFPSSFSTHRIDVIQGVLAKNCDFKNRKGRFINDFYQINTGGTDKVSFIYEFYLKCDTMRIITTYSLDKEVQLFDFKGERLSLDNPMIIDKSKELER